MKTSIIYTLIIFLLFVVARLQNLIVCICSWVNSKRIHSFRGLYSKHRTLKEKLHTLLTGLKTFNNIPFWTRFTFLHRQISRWLLWYCILNHWYLGNYHDQCFTSRLRKSSLHNAQNKPRCHDLVKQLSLSQIVTYLICDWESILQKIQEQVLDNNKRCC